MLQKLKFTKTIDIVIFVTGKDEQSYKSYMVIDFVLARSNGSLPCRISTNNSMCLSMALYTKVTEFMGF